CIRRAQPRDSRFVRLPISGARVVETFATGQIVHTSELGKRRLMLAPIGGPHCLYVSERHGTPYIEATGIFTAVAAIAQQLQPSTFTCDHWRYSSLTNNCLFAFTNAVVFN